MQVEYGEDVAGFVSDEPGSVDRFEEVVGIGPHLSVGRLTAPAGERLIQPRCRGTCDGVRPLSRSRVRPRRKEVGGAQRVLSLLGLIGVEGFCSFVEGAVVNQMRNRFPGRPPGPTGV